MPMDSGIPIPLEMFKGDPIPLGTMSQSEQEQADEKMKSEED